MGKVLPSLYVGTGLPLAMLDSSPAVNGSRGVWGGCWFTDNSLCTRLGEYGELRPPEYHLRPMVQFGLDMGSISGKMVGHFEYILRADKDYDPLHRSWDDISDAFKHAEIMSARLSV